MTAYQNKSFSVNVGGKKYGEGWDAIFGKKLEEPVRKDDCDDCNLCVETAPAPRAIEVGDRIVVDFDESETLTVEEFEDTGVRTSGGYVFWSEIESFADGSPVDIEASKPKTYEQGYSDGYRTGTEVLRPEIYRNGYAAGFEARDNQAPAACTLDDYQRRVTEWCNHNFPMKVTTEHRQKALGFMQREMFGLDDSALVEKLATLLAATEGRNHRPLIGAVEEIGELCHAHLKAEQGIRGTAEEHTAAKKDAIGDAMIYLLDYCAKQGFSAQECLDTAIAEISGRDWQKWPLNGKTA